MYNLPYSVYGRIATGLVPRQEALDIIKLQCLPIVTEEKSVVTDGWFK